MSYLVHYTLKKNKHLDRRTVEYIADVWHKEGHLNLHINGHYEVYKDYQSKLDSMEGKRGDKEIAKRYAMERNHIKAESQFYRILNKFTPKEKG